MFRGVSWILSLGVFLGVLALSSDFASAQAKNPCNPCGGKAQNPCNPCNPCGGTGVGTVPVNPCHAKVGTVFYIADPKGTNVATFTSEAPLEDTVGHTNQVGGYIVFDPSNPKRSGRGVVTVPVASLKTGIPLRDQHMRSAAWLDAAAHPNMTFHIDETKDWKEIKKTSEFQTYDVTLVGRFELHGKSKRLEAPARFTYLQESAMTKTKAPGDLVHGKAKFTIRLSDFGVTGPAGMNIIGTKVSDTPSIEIRFVASSSKPSAGNPCNPCNPCGKKAKNPCNPCNPCGEKAKNPCNPCGGKRRR